MTANRRHIERLASDQEWYGYLTLDNLDAVADRLRRMLADGRRYTFVEVNDGLGNRPGVRTSQTAKEIKAWFAAEDPAAFGGITIPDTYGVWGLHTSAQDQAAAREQDAERTCYLIFERDKLEITHYAPAGYRLYWVIALEEVRADA